MVRNLSVRGLCLYDNHALEPDLLRRLEKVRGDASALIADTLTLENGLRAFALGGRKNCHVRLVSEETRRAMRALGYLRGQHETLAEMKECGMLSWNWKIQAAMEERANPSHLEIAGLCFHPRSRQLTRTLVSSFRSPTYFEHYIGSTPRGVLDERAISTGSGSIHFMSKAKARPGRLREYL